MSKEPLGLYIFRFVLGFGLFVFMCMLYWSSMLLEQDLKAIKLNINELKKDLSAIKSQVEEAHSDILEALWKAENSSKESAFQAWGDDLAYEEAFSLENRPHIDPSLPNLLQEDSFYAETLPKLLGKGFKAKGVRKEAIVGRPDHLHPFSNWSHISAWNSQCTVALSQLEFGKYETMAPDMALKMEERKNQETGKPEFWVHLREGVFWQPLNPAHFSEDIVLAPHFLREHPVTAHDFKFYFDAIMNPSVEEAGAVALRNYIGDIEEIKVVDDLTLVVRWKTEEFEENGQKIPKVKYIAKSMTGSLRPLASFVYKYFPDGEKIVEEDSDPETYRKNSIWAQNFQRHWARHVIVSCGPWTFDGISDRQIRFKRNPDYYFPYAVLVEGLEVQFRESPDVIWQDFKAGKLDTYQLQPDQLVELEEFLNSEEYQRQVEQGLAINRLDYLGRSYRYIGWNEANSLFDSKRVRQALTMAIDRRRIIRQSLNDMGIQITGPFYRYSPSYDPSLSPWPYDVHAAKHTLRQEGWYDSDGDEVLDKEMEDQRTPFRFALTYYVKNPTTKAICDYVATALKEIGIDCRLNGVDTADLSATFDDKSFDALCLGWALGSPPEEPRQLWHSSGAKEKGSSNAIGFANAEADKIIEALQYEYDPEKRIALYHRFDAIIHEEAPYTFLYSPKNILLYREYLQNVFIPVERQDLIPGANVAEPDASIFWIKRR